MKAVDDGSIPPRSPEKLKFSEDPLEWIRENFMKYMPFSLIPIFMLISMIVWMVTPTFDYDEEYDEVIEDDLSEDESKKNK